MSYVENINRGRFIEVMVDNYKRQLKRDTIVFQVETDEPINWCYENFNNDCWFFDWNLPDSHPYHIFIKGKENIIAFKLRWT